MSRGYHHDKGDKAQAFRASCGAVMFAERAWTRAGPDPKPVLLDLLSTFTL
jgi:hypothetical protein